MPLTGQIGGDKVGGEKSPVEAHLCKPVADSVGVVDDDGESAAAEDQLGRAASPGSPQTDVGTQLSGLAGFLGPRSGGGETASSGRPRRAMGWTFATRPAQGGA
jgi:hypothetical protein